MEVLSKNDKVSFADAAERLSKELKRFGFDIKTSSPDVNLADFDPDIVAGSAAYMWSEAVRLSNIIDPTPSTKNEVQNLWAFLKNGGYRFSKDLFSYLNKDQVIEVYDSSFRALYRNPNFYGTCSYNIDKLHLYSWPELFSRKEEITGKVAIRVGAAFESPLDSIIDFEVGPHIAKEINSERGLEALMAFDVCAPIELPDGRRAVITTLRIEELGPNISQVN